MKRTTAASEFQLKVEFAREVDGRWIEKLVTRKMYRNHMHPEDIGSLLIQQSFNCASQATGRLHEDFPKVQ